MNNKTENRKFYIYKTMNDDLIFETKYRDPKNKIVSQKPLVIEEEIYQGCYDFNYMEHILEYFYRNHAFYFTYLIKNLKDINVDEELLKVSIETYQRELEDILEEIRFI